MNDLLIPVRAVHFAATVLLAGGLCFSATIARPALAAGGAQALPDARAFRRRLTELLGFALALALLSGAAWLILLAANLTGNSPTEAIRNGTAWTLLTQTEFGQAWSARLALALLLGLCLAPERPSAALCALGAAALMGSLAWSGHAAGTPGGRGDLHRGSDVLHLLAAGAWLGGLLPLALLLRGARRSAAPALAKAARAATLRFSAVAQVAVGVLLFSGAFNAWILVGGFSALVTTDYGLLLLGKIGLFAAMLLIAAVNRWHLSPRLPDAAALRELERNALIETALGLAILTLVAALGILPPASHGEHAHMH